MMARWMDRPVSVSPFLDPAALLRELGHVPNRAREGAPAADLLELKDGLELRMDMPGHDPGSIEVTVEGAALTVRSSRKEEEAPGRYLLRERRAVGTLSRTFVLPEGFDPGRVEATFRDGVLVLSVPKREEAKPRSIPVRVANGQKAEG